MDVTTRSPLAAIPFQRAAQDPTGSCLRDGDRAWDNAGFATAVRRLAQRLTALGVAPGDTVAVLLPNCAEIIATMFAAWFRGSALNPVNTALTDDEVRYQLEDSASAVIVGDQRARALAESLGIAWVDADLVLPTPGDPPVSDPATGADEEPCAVGDDFALVIYTSGTTGKPKGVLLDHDNLDAMSASLVEHFALTAADRSLLVLPLFHCNGLVAGTLAPLRAGGDVVVARRFSPDTFWDDVEAARPTYFSAVPTIYAVLEARTERKVDTTSLRFLVCGAAPMPAELITRFERRFGVPVVEGYGLSEGSVASTINPVSGRRKPGTVGIALPGQEVAVVSAQGVPQPAGQRGEVVIRGANVMRGYLGKPEETAKVLRDGWLHTGDRRDHRPRRLPAHRRPDQGHDHPRRGEHLPQGDRGVPLRAPRGPRGRGDRQAGPRPRRGAGRVRRHPARSASRRPTSCASTVRRPWPATRCPTRCTCAPSSRRTRWARW